MRLFLLALALTASAQQPAFDRQAFKHYIDDFNSRPTPDVVSHIPDDKAWAWLDANAPFFTCPDADIERTWYYRLWSFRKHIRQTPKGFILTEFIRGVKHATDFNAISCAVGHHIAEGRWLRDPQYIDQYTRFWLASGDAGALQRHYHQYSNWNASALYRRWLVDQRTDFLVAQLDALIADYKLWEKEKLTESGLFWQYDVRDGMEESISGGRRVKNLRPTINSYMYGNAVALAKIATLAGKPALAKEYEAKAAKLKTLVEAQLWNPQRRFFEARLESGALAEVREEIGFTPWLFHLPTPGKGYEEAWRQLNDPEGFNLPYGIPSAERRHPKFEIAEHGDDCQWNGPTWAFATTITLQSLANVLHDYKQSAITREDYFRTLQTYARSQQLTLPGGRQIAFIDESVNPLTGQHHTRNRKIKKGIFNARGDHYNHSAYADLIITGLAGLKPRPDNVVEIDPLLPKDKWDWFALDAVPYHGRLLTIIWDKTGRHFNQGKGLRLYANGKLLAASSKLGRLTAKLR